MRSCPAKVRPFEQKRSHIFPRRWTATALLFATAVCADGDKADRPRDIVRQKSGGHSTHPKASTQRIRVYLRCIQCHLVDMRRRSSVLMQFDTRTLTTCLFSQRHSHERTTERDPRYSRVGWPYKTPIFSTGRNSARARKNSLRHARSVGRQFARSPVRLTFEIDISPFS